MTVLQSVRGRGSRETRAKGATGGNGSLAEPPAEEPPSGLPPGVAWRDFSGDPLPWAKTDDEAIDFLDGAQCSSFFGVHRCGLVPSHLVTDGWHIERNTLAAWTDVDALREAKARAAAQREIDALPKSAAGRRVAKEEIEKARRQRADVRLYRFVKKSGRTIGDLLAEEGTENRDDDDGNAGDGSETAEGAQGASARVDSGGSGSSGSDGAEGHAPVSDREGSALWGGDGSRDLPASGGHDDAGGGAAAESPLANLLDLLDRFVELGALGGVETDAVRRAVADVRRTHCGEGLYITRESVVRELRFRIRELETVVWEAENRVRDKMQEIERLEVARSKDFAELESLRRKLGPAGDEGRKLVAVMNAAERAQLDALLDAVRRRAGEEIMGPSGAWPFGQRAPSPSPAATRGTCVKCGSYFAGPTACTSGNGLCLAICLEPSCTKAAVDGDYCSEECRRLDAPNPELVPVRLGEGHVPSPLHGLRDELSRADRPAVEKGDSVRLNGWTAVVTETRVRGGYWYAKAEDDQGGSVDALASEFELVSRAMHVPSAARRISVERLRKAVRIGYDIARKLDDADGEKVRELAGDVLVLLDMWEDAEERATRAGDSRDARSWRELSALLTDVEAPLERVSAWLDANVRKVSS